MKKCTLVLIVATAMAWGGFTSHANAGFHFNNGEPVGPNDILSLKLVDSEVVLDATAPPLTGNAVTDAAIVAAHKVPGGIISTVGQQIYGIFKITSIQDNTTGNQVWHEVSSGPVADRQQIDGVFFNYKVASITPVSATTKVVDFTGGNIQSYWSSNPNYNSGIGPFSAGWANVATSNGVGDGTDSAFLNAFGTDGVTPDPTITLEATFKVLGPNVHLTGVGDGFLTITFSSDLTYTPDAFDADTALGTAPGSQDLKFKSNFDNQPAGFTAPGADGMATPGSFQNKTGWSVASNDPIELETAALPEPASLVLFGIGGLLAGLARYRRSGAKGVQMTT